MKNPRVLFISKGTFPEVSAASNKTIYLSEEILEYVVAAKDYLPHVNIDTFEVLMNEVKRYPYPRYNFDYLKIISWMMSYTKFVNTYGENLYTPKKFHSKLQAQKAKFIYRILTSARYVKDKFSVRLSGVAFCISCSLFAFSSFLAELSGIWVGRQLTKIN